MITEIMILTYNRRGIVARCFKSLFNTLTRPDVVWSVLDNASTDGTAQWLLNLRKTYDGDNFNLYLSSSNIGVAGGRDMLLRKSVGDKLVFLDSDVVVHDDDWLDNLLAPLNVPHNGLVGPGGHWITTDRNGGWVWFNPSTPEYIGDVDVVSGYCQAFRRDAIDGFEIDVKAFPMYGCEDSDQCLWLKAHGYRIFCTGDIGVQHIYSNSAKAIGWQSRIKILEQRYRGKGIIKAEP